MNVSKNGPVAPSARNQSATASSRRRIRVRLSTAARRRSTSRAPPRRLIERHFHAERRAHEFGIGARVDRDARFAAHRIRPHDRPALLAQERAPSPFGVALRIGQQQIRREEALRPFGEIPGRRRAAGGLLGVRAVAARIPRIVRSTTSGRPESTSRRSRPRCFEAGDRRRRHGHGATRRDRRVLDDRRAVGHQERDRRLRRPVRIRDQDVGVEERAGRAFRQVVVAFAGASTTSLPSPPA